jgi:hypothetical protein
MLCSLQLCVQGSLIAYPEPSEVRRKSGHLHTLTISTTLDPLLPWFYPSKNTSCRSDIVFLRAWVSVDLPRFYNPVTNLLAPAPAVATLTRKKPAKSKDGLLEGGHVWN